MKRAVLAVCAVALVSVPTSALAQSTAPDAGAPAASCGSGQSVLLLIDQSKSLSKTDPNNERKRAAQQFVDALASADVPATLGVAGFGNSVTAVHDFALPDAREAAMAEVGAIADRNDDDNTDYVLALERATEYFQAIHLPAECKTLLWFTDGAYDISQVNGDTGKYTSSVDTKIIEGDFAAQICGPLQTTSKLRSPISEQIRAAGFTTKLLDLDVGEKGPTQAKLRQDTDAVIDRLLPPDGVAGGCSVEGKRVAIASAKDLAAPFFDEAQRAAGRTRIDCTAVNDGLPAGVVRSVAVLAEPTSAAVTINSPAGIESINTRTFTDDERRQPGNVRVDVEGGKLDRCFVDVDATVQPDSDLKVYDKASKSILGFVVGGPGASDDPALSIGPEHMSVNARIDGRTVLSTWDAVNRRWQIEVGPTTGTTPLALHIAPTITPVPEDALASYSSQIPVTSSPARPDLAWHGDTRLEGAGAINGTLVVTPRATTGGQLCVLATSVAVAGIGRVEVDGQAATCGPDDHALVIPARFVANGEANASATGAIPYSSTYTPPEGGVPQQLAEGSAQLPTFELAKRPDAGTWLVFAVALALLSGLLALIVLWFMTRRQSRLPDPSDYVMARIPLSRDDHGALSLVPEASLTMRDLLPVHGSRSRYDLTDHLSVRRWTSLNPFADIAAEVAVDDGVVVAAPSQGRSRAAGRRARIGTRFPSLLVVGLPDRPDLVPHAVLLLRRGTLPSVADGVLAQHLSEVNRTLTRQVAGAAPRPPVAAATAKPAIHDRPDRTEPASPPQADAVRPSAGSGNASRTPPPPPPRSSR